MSELKEACGIFGIYGNRDASFITHLALQYLQHRGQESAGILTSSKRKMRIYKGMGLVKDVFDKNILDSLKGDKAIGHVRYSTAGSSTIANAQPIFVDTSKGKIGIAHNGTLTNYKQLRQNLEESGAIFQTKSDSEVILHFFAKSKSEKLEDILHDSLEYVKGAYSLLMLTKKNLIAVRDSRGYRPLCLGRLDGSYVLASETCAFDVMGAKYEREVMPGEAVVIGDSGLESFKLFDSKRKTFCIFELIYFSRPDSFVFELDAEEIKKNFGRNLAIEHPADGDVVIAVPDSSNSIALGYSEESRIPFDFGLIRNHYVGRTFIQPKQNLRDISVKLKYNPSRGAVKDKRVVVVDDSIIRATNMPKLVKLLRDFGAKEVHVRIGSPPYMHPCYYGIDTPEEKYLIASHKSVEEIRRKCNAESLAYLSIEGMLKAVPNPSDFCITCFNGEYRD